MIAVRLRDAMREYQIRTGERVTYELLSSKTGLSLATLQAIGSRPDYNPTLATVELLCDALDCGVEQILERRTVDLAREG